MKRNLKKEERQMLAQTEVKNYFVNFEDGSSALFYVDQPNIGGKVIQKFCEKVAGKVIEVYHVPQEDLQYYCIEDRVWIDTPEKAKRMLDEIAA